MSEVQMPSPCLRYNNLAQKLLSLYIDGAMVDVQESFFQHFGQNNTMPATMYLPAAIAQPDG